MNDGTLVFTLTFPPVWPPNEDVLFYKNTIKTTLVKITGTSSGRLVFEVGSEFFISQKIIFAKAHSAIISFIWNFSKKQKIRVRVNSIELKTMSTRNVFVVESKIQQVSDVYSFNSPDSEINCSKWLNWRKERYLQQKNNPKKNRNIKSYEREVEDLENSLISIESHFRVFKDNEKQLLINILPLLRSLLCWIDKSKSYNPLLFRVAGRLNLPLPIYAFKDWFKDSKNPELFNDSTSLHFNDRPSVKQQFENEVLMDFQEWLTIQIIRDNTQTLTWKGLILKAANTISATHFDDDSHVIIDDMCSTTSMGRSEFTSYLYSICGVTLDLGKYILQNTKKESYE